MTIQGFATVYTFETEGSYTDIDNWDIYPGTTLSNGDTISIEADCENIDLEINNGYLVIEEFATYLSIQSLIVNFGGIVELKPNSVTIQIFGFLDYTANNPITTTNSPYITIINDGDGILGLGCLFDNVNLFYDNYGIQQSDLLECMQGEFMNSGIIEINSDYFFSFCNLDLADGTIQGSQAFTFEQYGFLYQTCTFCTATINNISELLITSSTNFKGTVNLNPPE